MNPRTSLQPSNRNWELVYCPEHPSGEQLRLRGRPRAVAALPRLPWLAPFRFRPCRLNRHHADKTSITGCIKEKGDENILTPLSSLSHRAGLEWVLAEGSRRH